MLSVQIYLLCLFVLFRQVLVNGENGPNVTIKNRRVQVNVGHTVGKGKAYFAFQGKPYIKRPVADLRFKSIKDPIVTIEDGVIQGKVGQTVGQGNTYYAFQGIPYAKPPVGHLRFKPPVKNDNWTNTLLATSDKSQCVQFSLPGSGIEGSEDCLYLNVYTTSLSNDNLPVMFWIHGGGFINGNSSYSSFGPDYFLDENVVFVSLNYRLGIFGFLSTEDLECPGNNGLKDQVLALKWVQRNIKHFGGNPNNVTIFGESAGSGSVSYLLQSPTTSGLFKAAIMESGTTECFWTLCRTARRSAFEVGALLAIFTINSTDLVNRLRQADYQALQQAADTIFTAALINNTLAGFAFGPVIEPYHKAAFFDNKSDSELSGGNIYRVPTIIGLNGNEITGLATDVPAPLRLLLNFYLISYDLDIRKLAPVDLTDDLVKLTAAASVIRSHYFNMLPIAIQVDAFSKFLSDDQFNVPIVRTVRNMRHTAPVYFYVFRYQGLLGLNFQRTTEITQRTSVGPGHAEELGYLFRNNDNFGSGNDFLIRRRLIKWWTNFAKYSDPTPIQDPLFQNVTWQQAGATSDLLYLNIDVNLGLKLNPFNDAVVFFDKIYTDYGNHPAKTG